MSTNKYILPGTFALGALAILWTGISFVGSNMLALLIILVIAGVYSVGFWELHRFRNETSQFEKSLEPLSKPLDKGKFDLRAWLGTLPPPIQNPIRLRVEGERVNLPGPVITPFLVGLLRLT